METAFDEFWANFVANSGNPNAAVLVPLKEVAKLAFDSGWNGGVNAGFARGYLTKRAGQDE